jgi:hypothetical protein
MNERQKWRFARIPDTSYPGQWSSFLFTGQYLQRVPEEVQPIHIITPVSLSNISMIICSHDHFLNYDGSDTHLWGYPNRTQIRRAIIPQGVIRPTLHLPRDQRHSLLRCGGTRAEATICPSSPFLSSFISPLQSPRCRLYIELFETWSE